MYSFCALMVGMILGTLGFAVSFTISSRRDTKQILEDEENGLGEDNLEERRHYRTDKYIGIFLVSIVLFIVFTIGSFTEAANFFLGIVIGMVLLVAIFLPFSLLVDRYIQSNFVANILSALVVLAITAFPVTLLIMSIQQMNN